MQGFSSFPRGGGYNFTQDSAHQMFKNMFGDGGFPGMGGGGFGGFGDDIFGNMGGMGGMPGMNTRSTRRYLAELHSLRLALLSAMSASLSTGSLLASQRLILGASFATQCSL